MKTLVTRANGQLGKSIKSLVNQQKIGDSFVFATRDQFDLSNPQSVKSYFESYTFDLIINSAAYTSVEGLEKEIDYYLRMDEEREAIAEQGYDTIQEYTFDKIADRMIKENR